MVGVRLTRVSSTHNEGTFGALVVGGLPFCVTLEPYNRDNVSNISSIPAGQYVCKPYDSPTYGKTYIVSGVQGRSSILFHWGNRDSNTEGCILLGDKFGKLGDDYAILNSKDAFKRFCEVIGRNKFSLVVVDSY
jgi:hypothetical protein